jgi:hypothetical protein
MIFSPPKKLFRLFISLLVAIVVVTVVVAVVVVIAVVIMQQYLQLHFQLSLMLLFASNCLFFVHFLLSCADSAIGSSGC